MSPETKVRGKIKYLSMNKKQLKQRNNTVYRGKKELLLLIVYL